MRRTGSSAPNRPLLEGLDRIPTWAPVVLYLVTTVILFREFIFSGDMLLGQDTLALGYTARLFFAEALVNTGFPGWNPQILGGTPFLESLAGGDSLHPLSVALLVLTEVHRALGWKLVLHVFLSGIFMFGWLRMLGVSRGSSLVGGLGFLLAPWFVTLVFPGHDGKMFVTAMTPLLFWLSEWMWRRRDLVPGALLALSIALVIFSTHFQMAYFLFGGVGAYMVFRTVAVGRLEGWGVAGRQFGLFLAFSVAGAGVAGVQLIPAYDYVTEDSRRAATTTAADPTEARAYSTSWSLHPEEMMSLAVPEFIGSSVGGPSWTSDTYWGRNPFKLNHEYLGALVLLLSILAFVPGVSTGGQGRGDTPVRGPPPGLRWFFLGLGAVGLLFTLGAHTPVWRFFWEFVPGISLFRAPSMAIFIPGFAALTLTAMGMDRAARLMAEPAGRRRVLWTLGTGAGLLAAGGLMAASGALQALWLQVFDPGLDANSAAALERAWPHATRGFLVVALLAGGLTAAWWAAGQNRLSGVGLAVVVALLVGVDMFRVNVPFIQTIDPARVTVPDPNVRYLMQQQRDSDEPFRVFSMQRGGEDVVPATFGLELAGGHHPNDLQRYREFIGMTGGGFPEHLLDFDPVIMDLLNIRYILWPDGQYGPLEGAEPVSQSQGPGGQVIASVYSYPGGPRARVVGEAVVVDEGQAMDRILAGTSFDPRSQVVLEAAPPMEPGGPAVTGSVRWIERGPDRMVLEVTASGPGFLVVGDNWFPAWRASVDGEAAPVLQANHVQRAVPIPGGTHRVEMWYESDELQRALWLSFLSILLVTGAGLGSGLRRRRRGEPA